CAGVHRCSGAAMISSGFATLAISLVPIASLPAATDPADLPEPSGEQLADAVRVWDPAGVVQTWDPTGSVSEVDEVESGEDTTITLATDILTDPVGSDRKSTRLNSSHVADSSGVFRLK